MHRRTWSVLGSLVFFVVAPGTVAGWIPFTLTRWRVQSPIGERLPVRLLGGTLAALGLAALIDCFARFALKGFGTPAPVAPPSSLVVDGPYRHVRNPMYVAVVAIILGQALLFGSARLLTYAAGVWTAFHLFVVLYEEPNLEDRFGHSYDTYRAHVRRWTPRLRGWPPKVV